MPRPELTFSTRFRGKYAEAWTVRGWSKDDQFVVARQGADGLHVSRHRDGFVALCAIDKDEGRHYLPDTASREVRSGTVLVANIVRPPIVCVLSEPLVGEVVYEESPHWELHVVHRLFYEPGGTSAPLPGLRLPGAKVTGVLQLTSGGTVVVISHLIRGESRTMTLRGKMLTPASHTTPVGGVMYLTANGLVVYEGVNADALAADARPA